MGALFFLLLMLFLLFWGVAALVVGIILGKVNKKKRRTPIKVISIIAKVLGLVLCLVPLGFFSFIGIANYSQRQYEKSLEAEVSHRNYDRVLQLLEKGENPDKCRNSYTPLMHACTGADGYEIAKLLIEYGADVNAKYQGYSDGKDKGYTPLIYAAGDGGENLLMLLIENGAEINYQAEDGVNALMRACHYGNSSIVILLVQNGADVNAVDAKGRSALSHAASSYFTTDNSIMEYLIQNGANASILTNDGKSLPY